MVTIRAYRDFDRQAVIGLWELVFTDTQPHNDPNLALDAKIKQDDGLLLVAEKDGQCIGTVVGGYDGHRGWIYSLAVQPKFRRQGVAIALLESMVTLLKKRGCLKLNLQVRNTNKEVLKVYEKAGFGIDDVVSMGKKLY